MKRNLEILLISLFAALLIPFRVHGGEPQAPHSSAQNPSQSPAARWVHPDHGDAAARASQALAEMLSSGEAPAMSVAIAVGGRLVFAEAVGLADAEGERPADLETRFRIGSTSKAVTAAALGRLVDAGKLDLDRPVSEYLPAFPPKRWPFTVRQLAGHQAGIRHYQGTEDYLNFRPYGSVAEALTPFQGDPLLFQPGTGYHYSTYGFTVISAVLEAVAHQDFLALMDGWVFEPLGLRLTQAEIQGEDEENRAVYYTPTPFGRGRMRAVRVDNSNKWAGGGFESTPSELATLGAAMLGGDFLRPDTRDLLFTPQRLASGEETGHGYGLGWRSGEATLPGSGRAVRVVHHGGTAMGGRSFLALLPDQAVVVSLLENHYDSRTRFWDFAEQALRLAELFLPAGEAAAGNGIASQPPRLAWR